MKQFRIVLMSALAVLGCKSKANNAPTAGSNVVAQGSAVGSASAGSGSAGSGSGSSVGSDAGSASAAGSGSASAALPADVVDFQQRVRAIAKADSTVIAQWGPRPIVVSKDKTNGPDCKPQPPAANIAGNVAMLSSAERQTVSYVFEVADHKLLAMTVPIDGRTVLPEDFNPDAKGTAEPTWTVSKDALFHHQQNHRGGYESLDLMVNGDHLVVAKHEALEDVRDSDKPKQASFLVDNSCACNACPALDGFKHGLELSLTTPGAAAPAK